MTSTEELEIKKEREKGKNKERNHAWKKSWEGSKKGREKEENANMSITSILHLQKVPKTLTLINYADLFRLLKRKYDFHSSLG